MRVVVVIAVVGVVAVAAVIALAMYVAKGSTRSRSRTTWLCAALLLAGLVTFAVLNVTAVFYEVPPAWTVALVVCGLTMLGLIALIGNDVGWRPSRLLALAGMLAAGGMVFLAIGMSGLGGGQMQPLYRTRAAQIAKANDFTALLPAGLDMPTDMLPVDTLPESDAGLSVSYEDFWLQERKAEGAASVADLEKLVAAGERPFGPEGPAIPDTATITRTTVKGQPAVVVKYTVTEKSGDAAKVGADVAEKDFENVLLVTVIDGVDVRMSSESGVRESNGEWIPFGNLGTKRMVGIAETLEPVE